MGKWAESPQTTYLRALTVPNFAFKSGQKPRKSGQKHIFCSRLVLILPIFSLCPNIKVGKPNKNGQKNQRRCISNALKTHSILLRFASHKGTTKTIVTNIRTVQSFSIIKVIKPIMNNNNATALFFQVFRRYLFSFSIVTSPFHKGICFFCAKVKPHVFLHRVRFSLSDLINLYCEHRTQHHDHCYSLQLR